MQMPTQTQTQTQTHMLCPSTAIESPSSRRHSHVGPHS
jgi:hypothetical protein